jgi:hypothetical protein
MKKNGLIKPSNAIPKNAVLLIPEPENESAPYGIKPGYYNSRQLLQLLDKQKQNADAIQFIADMLETGNPKDDGFAKILKTSCSDPAAITRIIQTCKEEAVA